MVDHRACVSQVQQRVNYIVQKRRLHDLTHEGAEARSHFVADVGHTVSVRHSPHMLHDLIRTVFEKAAVIVVVVLVRRPGPISSWRGAWYGSTHRRRDSSEPRSHITPGHLCRRVLVKSPQFPRRRLAGRRCRRRLGMGRRVRRCWRVDYRVGHLPIGTCWRRYLDVDRWRHDQGNVRPNPPSESHAKNKCLSHSEAVADISSGSDCVSVSC